MNKLKFSIAFDGLFIFGISFFIFYALVKQKIYSVWSATLLSAFLSALVALFYIIIASYKQRKKVDIEQDNQNFQAFKRYLYFLQTDKIIKLISDYLDKTGKPYEVKKSAFCFKKEKTVLFYDFTPDLTTLTTCIEFYKKTPKSYKTAILSCGYDDKVKEFFAPFEKVQLYLANDLYTSLKLHDLLPNIELPKKQKFEFNKLIARFLRKENVKKFFLWGAVLTLFSTITYYKVFYALLGTAFLLIAVYLKFFIKEKN